MPHFAVERYQAGWSAAERAAESARIRAAVPELHRVGVRHVATLDVPADEMWMHLVEAERAADVIVAYRRSRLAYDRIVEVELEIASALGI